MCFEMITEARTDFEIISSQHLDLYPFTYVRVQYVLRRYTGLAFADNGTRKSRQFIAFYHYDTSLTVGEWMEFKYYRASDHVQ